MNVVTEICRTRAFYFGRVVHSIRRAQRGETIYIKHYLQVFTLACDDTLYIIVTTYNINRKWAVRSFAFSILFSPFFFYSCPTFWCVYWIVGSPFLGLLLCRNGIFEFNCLQTSARGSCAFQYQVLRYFSYSCFCAENCMCETCHLAFRTSAQLSSLPPQTISGPPLLLVSGDQIIWSSTKAARSHNHRYTHGAMD